MSRPSQQIDALLIASGMALLPETGCAGLSVRKLTEHAGVNLGMFHYHFKSKDNFIRAVLQRLYEAMFTDLQVQADSGADAVSALQAAFTVLGAFARANRKLLFMLVSEALRGEALPLQFLRENLPRHLAIIVRLVQRGQAEGRIVPVPVPQLLPFLAGGIVGPILAGGAIERQGTLAPELAGLAQLALLSEQALAQRIELALRAIAVQP
ncbi:TetR/AcrR family transcriptional regulator [Massilia sp. CF038]|uniref:TetR/AcrR family transcriptional regulator n=1 Tax=Massilia sp. CF038 TaxID=1881045 RepID=UPI000915B928|nr:TetR/AcrR family transcriptional regulator [Massilia sp. CF038]SHH61464.1 transcriptional regulator, TetR family [Massilia sp. CF038]